MININNFLQDICDIMHTAYERNLITMRDGNCSFRIKDDNRLFITPSGVKKSQIKPSMFVELVFDDEEHIDIQKARESGKASGEIMMHYLLQQHFNGNEESRCVLHLHPTYTVSTIYANLNIIDVVRDFPEFFRYTRVGKTVDAYPALSDDLATNTYNSLMQNNIVGQKNHGVTALDATPYDAFEHIERLEHVCKMALLARR
jgi:ribulose-5-phosphate 4-epimerase/fuculose-1-phosphate aldolase